jgi:phage repressor protein C with HTH and peptisase S24 domain
MTDIQKIDNKKKFNRMLEKVQFKFPVAEISAKTGYSKGSISEILNEKRGPTDEFLAKFALEFKIDMTDSKDFEDVESKPADVPTGYYYPDVNAAAGYDKETINDELQRIPINLPNWDKGIDFINVFGDSMYPKFCSGEIIGIKEVELQYLNFGFAYVVILKDEQVLLKFIKKGSDKDFIILESENKFYEPKEYHLNQIKKIFIIKGVITKTTM